MSRLVLAAKVTHVLSADRRKHSGENLHTARVREKPLAAISRQIFIGINQVSGLVRVACEPRTAPHWSLRSWRFGRMSYPRRSGGQPPRVYWKNGNDKGELTAGGEFLSVTMTETGQVLRWGI